MKLGILGSGDICLRNNKDDWSWYWLLDDGTLSKDSAKAKKSAEGRNRSTKLAQEFVDKWLPPKEWLTTEQVLTASKLSDEMALLCSLNHWKQIVMNFWNFENSVFESKVDISYDYCALCQRHKRKRNCPLELECDGCCNEWKNFRDDRTLDNAIAMFNRLQELYNSLYKDKSLDERIEQCKKDIKALEKEKEKLESQVFKQGDILYDGLCKVLLTEHGQSGKFKVHYKEGGMNIFTVAQIKRLGYKKIGNAFEIKI